MTKTEQDKYRVLETELSDKLKDRMDNLLEGFGREHNCRVTPVILYSPAIVGQPSVVSGIQFQCVSEDRIAQTERERNPKVITSPALNGKLMN